MRERASCRGSHPPTWFWTTGLVAVFSFVFWTASCSGTPSPSPETKPPVASRVPQPTVAPTATAAAEDMSVELIWWTPEFLSPQATQATGPVLAEQLAAFEASREGKVRVSPMPKARYGKGGLLDLLLTARPVAASVLPDLVTLDIGDLEKAVEAGVLQPLDVLLDEGIVANLYPFARSAGRLGNQLYAVPFVADLEHVATRPSQLQEVPETWEKLLEDGNAFLLAVAAPLASSIARPAQSLSHAVLAQYISAGATFSLDTRQLAVEEAPLRRLLTFYEAAAKSGVIPPGASEISETDDVWSVYAQGKVPIAYVGARRFLAERTQVNDIGFAAAPGASGTAKPIASGWALAIVTADPARQQAAAQLIAWLMEPGNAGSLAQIAGWLPVSPEALATWDADPYHEFLGQQLAEALSQPIGTEYAQVASRIQEAVLGVLGGESSVDQAMEAALNPGQ